MNTYKRLFNNTIIFAIGNFGSRLVSIILVPLYTYYLSTSEYGVIDLVTTTSSLLLPFISFSIYDAILRFTMERASDRAKIFTNGLFVSFCGSIILIIFYPVYVFFGLFEGVLHYFIIIILLQSIQMVLSNFVRAIGKIRLYAVNGISMALVVGLLNLLLIVYLDYGLHGYLSSIIISNIFSIVFLAYFSDLKENINFRLVNFSFIKSMLSYSIPLIPNSFMWWMINTSSRFFILFYEGVSQNGLYAVANKIPSLLQIINSIFFQAWQLSAIEESESENRSKLYSDVFSYFSCVMFLGASAILIVLKFIVQILFEEAYNEAWEFVPFLLVGLIFSSFSSFIGTNYVALKKTRGVMNTTVIGAISNVLLNFFLVPNIGTIGASIAMMFSFLITWLVRVKDTKKFIDVNYNLKKVAINTTFILLQIASLFINLSMSIEIIYGCITFVLLIIVNRQLFIFIFSIFMNRVNK